MSNTGEPNFYQMMLGLPQNLRRPNHYQLLDVDPTACDSETIRDAAAAQNGKLMTWQNSKYFKEAGKLMLELAQARSVLLDPDKKLDYDQRLGLISVDEEPVILLEAEPEEDPIILETVEPPPAPKPPPSRRRTRRGQTKRPQPVPESSEKKKPLPWVILSGGLFTVMGLGALAWSAWHGGAESTAPANLVKSPDVKENPSSDRIEVEAENTKRQDNENTVLPTTKPATVEKNAIATNPPLNANPQVAGGPPPAKSPFDANQAAKHQSDWAKHLKVPLEATNTIGMKLRFIPPGEFPMGSPPEEPTRNSIEALHPVRLTKPFYAGEKEVTVAEFEEIMKYVPPLTSGQQYNLIPNLPVMRPTWYECVYFCNQLSIKEGFPPYYDLSGVVQTAATIRRLTANIKGGDGYRLPTEAEWEYMCRAGTTTAFHFGETLPENNANFRGSNNPPGSPITSTLKPGGKYPANPFGLYDLHGNLKEWCFDTLGPYAANSQPLVDPIYTRSFNRNSTRKISRGGSYSDFPTDCRSAARGSVFESYRGAVGFRVVRTIGPTTDFVTKNSGSSPVPNIGDQPALAMLPFDADQAKQHQADWAKHLGVSIKEETPDGIALQLIPAGEFRMGSPIDEPFRISIETPHVVRLTQPIYLGATEITIDQYRKIVGQGGRLPGHLAILEQQSPKLPMDRISWFDSVVFCNELSKKEGYPPYYSLTNIARRGPANQGPIVSADVSTNGGEGYRLPTEAEWEFACRGGTETPWHFGSQIRPSQARIRPDNGAPEATPTDVASFAPNAFGLYDMHGNVLEWCFDYMDPRFYTMAPVEDPVQSTRPANVPDSRLLRVVRGGYYRDDKKRCRSATRSGRPLSYNHYVGFRVARTPVSKTINGN